MIFITLVKKSKEFQFFHNKRAATLIKSLAYCIFLGTASMGFSVQSNNQTASLSPILQNQPLPVQVQIVQADFMLPNGLQSYVVGTFNGKWLLLAGRTNGLHGFGNGNDDFLPSKQNTTVYVVDPINETVVSRSLNDPSSGLSQNQIDLLSVTASQAYQKGETLYMCGGYGVETSTGNFSTKDVLTAINIPGLMSWVLYPSSNQTAVQHIRQVSHPVFQVTGGYMNELEEDLTLLVFGQNFQGFYNPSANGLYSKQVRRFHIHDDGKELWVEIFGGKPLELNQSYRRRDLNVVPTLQCHHGRLEAGLVAFSGVFTLETGIWTVPVVIKANGKPSMENPSDPKTFKQGMNNYACATLPLFSAASETMYTLFFGGISFGFFSNGDFETDPEIPFINQVTLIKEDNMQNFTQYLVPTEYPFIPATFPHPGNPLLFGAEASLILANDVPTLSKDIIDFDALSTNQIVVGYIVGGIQSTVPNTETQADSSASAYIFKVLLSRVGKSCL